MSFKRSKQCRSGIANLAVLGLCSAVFGTFIFSCGFLLTRSELTNTTYLSHHLQPEFQRVILLLVDGLYIGLFPPIDNATRMPYLRELIYQKNESRNYFLAHFIADPPTTTMQRLKALLTGSMPTFIDAGSNFGGSEIQEDNILKQWALTGKKICFVGDQVWVELLPNRFSESYPLPAFNIKDLDTVDTAVKEYILQEINRDKCDVLIGHMLGIDHCGHTFGRSHPEMSRKLAELDEFLRHLLLLLRKSDLLFVFGDHGMTATGDHGGDSVAEVDATLFAYTPRGFLRDSVPSVATTDEITPLPTVEQVDLVPTLAALTGTPIPFSNLGIVITQLLNFDLVGPVNENFKQIFTYTKEYHNRFGLVTVPAEMDRLIAQNSTQPCSPLSLQECLAMMRALRASFRTHWTRMDAWCIALGFLLTLNALLAFLALDNDLGDPGLPYVLAILSAIVLGLLKLTLVALLPLALAFYWLGGLWFRRRSCSISFGTLVSGVLMVIVVLTSCSNSFIIQEARVLSYFLQTLLMITCIFCLGSTRHWSAISSSILLCVGLLWAGRYLELCREESPSTSVCVNLGTDGDDGATPNIAWLLTRLSTLSGERLRYLTGPRLLLASTGLGGALLVHRRCLTAWGNLCVGGLAGILLSVSAPLAVLGLPFLWLLDALIASTHSGDYAAARYITLETTFLATLRINVARALFMLGGALSLVLIYRPLLVTAAVPTVVPPRISWGRVYLSGLATVYTSWLLTALVMAPLFILLVLLGDVYVWPCLGILVCLLLPPFYLLHCPRVLPSSQKMTVPSNRNYQTQVLSLLHAASGWTTAIYACLLGELGFYCLGHQPTFPSIVWEAAFAVLEGDRVVSTTSTFLSAALVLAHTFAAQILITAALPLVLFIPLHRLSKGPIGKSNLLLLPIRSEACSQALGLAFDRLFRRYLIAHFSLFTGHLLCAFLLRRHLMVWKIFAPRLVFSFCGLGVVLLTTLVVRCLVVWRLHGAVTRMHRQLLTNPNA
ncbi:GPI ethanolamine phosphate transferase 3 [Taenia crassiceps]|uniref:GPI ethanolamine phosphate transferase 3 n=1 Tax=Taenia crassiceps TaxID=6207 RepID=A0ABR4QQW9_9CEST